MAINSNNPAGSTQAQATHTAIQQAVAPGTSFGNMTVATSTVTTQGA
jgi:hypothetical protein